MKIAVLDDDKTQLQLIEQTLIGGDNQWIDDIECQFFSSGEALLETVKQEFFDCILLDRRVEDMSGDVILQWIRQYGEAIHNDYSIVIMLTSVRAESDIVNGLTIGANDYVVKPFRPAELVARIKRALETKRSLDKKTISSTVLKSNEQLTNGFVHLHNYEFDMYMNRVKFDGHYVELTPNEFALALLLFRNAGRPLSRQFISETIFRRADANSRSLDTHICRIRNSLQLNPKKSIVLKNIYGFGFRLDVLGLREMK